MKIDDVYTWTTTPKQRILAGMNGRGIMSSAKVYDIDPDLHIEDLFPDIDDRALNFRDSLIYNQLGAIENALCVAYMTKHKLESYVGIKAYPTSNIVILDKCRNMHVDPMAVRERYYIRSVRSIPKGSDPYARLEKITETDFIVGEWL